MSVHIPSTLKVAQLNVASTAAVGNLRLQDGEGGSWLLYADRYSTKLISNPPTSASFELSGDYVNFNLSGCVYSAGIHTESLTVDNNATIVGTLEAYKLKARVLDVSNLDLSNTTLNVSSITVAGAAEINTLSAVQILAEQGDIQQLTVNDTLTANNAVLERLTVIHTLTVHTVEAQNEVNAPLIVADRAEFDTLYVNGKAITGSSSGGGSGGGGDVTIPADVTLDTLTANETISIPGAQYVNGDIELAADKGIRVGTAGTIEIADAGSDAIVRIDSTGVKALKVSASTAFVGALTSSSTVTTQNLTVSNSGVIDGSLRVKELNVSSSVTADSAEITTATITDLTSNTAEVETLSAVDILTESISAGSINVSSIQIAEDAIISGSIQGTNITAFGSVTAPLIAADDIQVGNITATNNLTADSIAATSITTGVIQTSGRAQFDSARVSKDMTIGSRLDVETLYVNGVQITDNGGESELPPTIQVSEVQALPPYNVVSIPQMQGRHLTLSDSMGSLLPSENYPLALHVFLKQNSYNDADFGVSSVTSLRAESGFRAPVTFVSTAGETQDEARFTQRTIATACQEPINGSVDMGDVSIEAVDIYYDRAWFEVYPAGLNSINNEQSTVTLRADRSLIDDEDNSANAVVGGATLNSTPIRLNSAAFTLTPTALTARVTRQLPRSKTNVFIYDKDTGVTPALLTPLLYTTDIKTEITPSCFKAEATATLMIYDAIADETTEIESYVDNLKASIQLDVSPDAYTGTLASVGDVYTPNSGIYVRPNNVIIQAPSELASNLPNNSNNSGVPVDLNNMGVGLFGRNIVLEAEDAIKLNASTSIIGALRVSGRINANAASVVGSLSTQSLYVNGIQITGNGGTSSSGFSGQYTEGNVVLGRIENGSDFTGLVQQNTVTALGYKVYWPNTATIPPFDSFNSTLVGIRMDESEVRIKAPLTAQLYARSVQFYASYSSEGYIHMYTRHLLVADVASGSPMVRLNVSTAGTTNLRIGEPERLDDGLCLQSLDIAAVNTSIRSASDSKMFSMYSDSAGSSITLAADASNILTLRSGGVGLQVNVNELPLIDTNEDNKGMWQFGNKDTRTNFYTNYNDVTSNLDSQGVLDKFSEIDALQACLPLSLMLELFQLKSGLTWPPQS